MDIPNCYSFIKLRPIVSLSISIHGFMMMSYIFHREAKNIPQRHRHGMSNIILDYMDVFFSVTPKTIERKFINVPEGDGGKGKNERSENQINRVYYVIVLVRNRGHLFKRSRFGATKEKKFFYFSFLLRSSYPSPIQ